MEKIKGFWFVVKNSLTCRVADVMRPCAACVARDKYIKLLEAELDDLAVYLHIHGMKFQRLKAFEAARKAIKDAEHGA